MFLKCLSNSSNFQLKEQQTISDCDARKECSHYVRVSQTVQRVPLGERDAMLGEARMSPENRNTFTGMLIHSKWGYKTCSFSTEGGTEKNN